ncbi:MAG: DUF4857 domain-containing protein [Ignavibacteria bacterium]
MKNIKITRIVLALIIVLVASIYLPGIYWKVTREESNRLFINYSPIKKDFIFKTYDVRKVKYTDTNGNEYNRDEFEELLPLVNYRQLILSGKMPDSINGVPIDPQEVRLNNVPFRIRPVMINANTIPLFPLMESQSGRVKLELPPDYFRITDRMEFITSLTNTVNEEKSILFTDALEKEGFAFPAKGIYGNPSTMKPFDEGYFVVDNKNEVYHIKMVKGKPFCRHTQIPNNLHIVFMSIGENNLKEFYGAVVTETSEVYLISYDNYKLIKLPVKDYNYRLHNFMFKGNLFYRTITIYSSEDGIKAIVTDRNYETVATYDKEWKHAELSTASIIIAPYLFPFEISVEKSTTPMVNLYFEFYDLRCLIIAVLLVVLTFIYLRKKQVPVRDTLIYYLLVLFTGLYGFIAVMSLREFKNDSNI